MSGADATAAPVREAAPPAGDPPPSAAVWCSGLRKRYGKRPAVEDVSLEVGRGEVVGLLGPNGAGKTTVIKSILGLVGPVAGEVMLLGRPASTRTRAAVSATCPSSSATSPGSARPRCSPCTSA